MTAPAPALLPRTAAPDRARDAAPAAAASSPRVSDSTGFAAHLAREAQPADEVPGGQPSSLAGAIRAARIQPEAAPTPEVTADTGKVLPVTRQKPAAQPAALLALAVTQAVICTDSAADDTAEPAATPVSDEPDAAIAALPLPGAVLLPLPTPAPPTAPAPTGTTPATTTASATATMPATPSTADAAPPAAQTAQAAHPAAFAVTSLVLEREVAAEPAPQPATPDESAPDTATQNAARAQPSTLAALTGAPTPERPTARKLRTEGDPALHATKAAALPVPETAAALAQAQPSFAPASSAATPAASGPQPISFDQLVDSIARARDGLDPAGPVSVALHHAEFGRVSLRIEGDATGLSVAMASHDPAFAPAVAAAHAAAVSAEPARTAGAEHRAETPGQSLSQGQGQSQSGTGQQRHSAYTPAAPRTAANPARSPAPGAERRGGIFA